MTVNMHAIAMFFERLGERLFFNLLEKELRLQSIIAGFHQMRCQKRDGPSQNI